MDGTWVFEIVEPAPWGEIIAGIAVAVSLVGIWLTWRATKKSIGVAMEAVQAAHDQIRATRESQRPYLVPEKLTAFWVRGGMGVTCDIFNKGPRAAHNLVTRWYRIPEDFSHPLEGAHFESLASNPLVPTAGTRALFSVEPIGPNVQVIPTAYLVVMLTYEDEPVARQGKPYREDYFYKTGILMMRHPQCEDRPSQRGQEGETAGLHRGARSADEGGF